MDTEAGLYVWLLLLLNLHVKINGLDHILATHSSLSHVEDERLPMDISKLLNRIKMVFNYDYIVLWRKDNTTCILDNLIKNVISSPLMVNSHDSKKNSLSYNHSRSVLILSCWEKVVSAYSAEPSASEYPFNTRHLVWVENIRQVNEVCAIVPDIASFRHLIVDRMSLEMQVIRTCNRGETDEINYNGIQGQFGREFFYMKGLPIVTESDQLPPRSVLYYDNNGNLQLDGFVGHCIISFAKRHEAELIITPPSELRKATYFELLENKTFEGLLDLPAIVSPLQLSSSDVLYSYPLELMEYCYMIPLPRLMETNRVFTYIVEFHVMIVIIMLSFLYGILLTIGTRKSICRLTFTSIVLNDKSIRGLLGQSFVMPAKPSFFMQYVCFLLCHTSLIIATTYEAYLQSHLTHPALGRRVGSYQDMREAGLKIAIATQDLRFLSSSTIGKHRDLYKTMSSFDDFLQLRASMDTRYVYPVSNSRWEVFSQQQQLFQRPLFYYSQNVCLEKLVFLSVPFRPDLPYKALFNQHLLDVRDTGLLQYWINDNFYAMVRLKYMRFSDLSTPEQYGDAIVLNDFKWIWILYGSFIALALLVFAGEMIYQYICDRVKPSPSGIFTEKADARPQNLQILVDQK